MSAPAALRDDVPGVDAGVADGHQAPAPHLALRHVQQEAELAVLAPGVAAAPPGHRLSNVESRLAGPRGRGSGRGHGLGVGGVSAAVEARTGS